jgi:hypothetical protein
MAAGALFEVLDLSACALASLIVVFVFVEIGAPFHYLVWICTSLITFLVFPGKTVWLMYLFFGVFPIIKAYIERLPRFAWLILKLVYVNACIIAMAYLVQLIFSIPLFSGESKLINALLYAGLNIAFLAYDRMITLAVRVYFERLRPRISKYLK